MPLYLRIVRIKKAFYSSPRGTIVTAQMDSMFAQTGALQGEALRVHVDRMQAFSQGLS